MSTALRQELSQMTRQRFCDVDEPMHATAGLVDWARTAAGSRRPGFPQASRLNPYRLTP